MNCPDRSDELECGKFLKHKSIIPFLFKNKVIFHSPIFSFIFSFICAGIS